MAHRFLHRQATISFSNFTCSLRCQHHAVYQAAQVGTVAGKLREHRAEVKLFYFLVFALLYQLYHYRRYQFFGEFILHVRCKVVVFVEAIGKLVYHAVH